METTASSVPDAQDARWRDALQHVVDDPSLLRGHSQPIVELTSGQVVGYELLSRFTGPWAATPDVWFAAAEIWGFNSALQGRVLRAGIDARSMLQPDTFLTVNVDPHLLGHADVADVLMGARDLSRLVLELTEHTQIQVLSGAEDVLAHVRSSGGRIAMDDAGTGYAGLSTLLTLRPDIVKLDRELITGVDADPVKRALVEVIGDLAGRMDGWLLAEGIETRAELETLISLGVPLGQGYFLARPSASMLAALEPEQVEHIRRTASRTSLRDHVASLIRPTSVGTDRDQHHVLLGPNGLAAMVRIDTAGAAQPRWAPAMTVAPGAHVIDVARRAMSRPDHYRFAPVVCTDRQGTVLGLIPVDDMIAALCALSSSSAGR